MLEHIVFTTLTILLGLVLVGLALMPFGLLVGAWAWWSSMAHEREAKQLIKLRKNR